MKTKAVPPCLSHGPGGARLPIAARRCGGRITRVFITMFVTMACAVGGSSLADSNQPKLVCDAPSYDFGKAYSDTEKEHTFILRNEGNAPLVIHRVHSSCGCTVANLTNSRIEPGEEQELTAKISLRGRHGSQRMHISVQSNDPENPTFRLGIEGRAIRDFQVRPRLLNFGVMTPGATATRTLDLISEEEPFHLQDIAASVTGLGLRVTEVKPGHHYRLSVELSETSKIGMVEGNLRIRTDHPRHPEIAVPVSGTVTDQQLLVSPENITLPAGWEGTLIRHVVVRSVDQSPFTITKIDSPHEDIEVRSFPMGNAGYRLQISNLRSDLLDTDSRLTITTDRADIDPISIPIHRSQPEPMTLTTTRLAGGGANE